MTRWNPTPDVLAILEQRALQYGPSMDLDSYSLVDWLVVLVSGGTTYCVPALAVTRVVKIRQWVRLPGTSAHLVGLLMAGGELQPMISVAPLLGTSIQAEGVEAVIVGDGDEQVALVSESSVRVEPDPGGESNSDSEWIERTVPKLGGVLRVESMLSMARNEEKK